MQSCCSRLGSHQSLNQSYEAPTTTERRTDGHTEEERSLDKTHETLRASLPQLYHSNLFNQENTPIYLLLHRSFAFIGIVIMNLWTLCQHPIAKREMYQNLVAAAVKCIKYQWHITLSHSINGTLALWHDYIQLCYCCGGHKSYVEYGKICRRFCLFERNSDETRHSIFIRTVSS